MGIQKKKRIAKMKFFSLIGVALANEEFAACAERDANVDVTPFYEAQTKANGDCFKYFVNAMYECTKIQAEHPFCVEDSGAYDPLMCTLKINQCCVEELAGINDCL